MPSPLRIALIGDYDPTVTAHQAIPRALADGARDLGTSVEPSWLATESIPALTEGQLGRYHGFWCAPASPYRSEAGALRAIRFARERQRPFLGTCGGFQHALLEYARNGLGLLRAAHAEREPGAALALIAPLGCALVERSGSIRLSEGSRLRRIYGVDEVLEEYHCSYGLNPALEDLLAGGPLRIAGRDAAGEVRAVELDQHPFFVATLFQPERGALRGQPVPVATALLTAASCQD